MEYETIEPFGDRRADWQAASICTAFANITLAARGSTKRFRMKDFLLEFGNEKDLQTPKEEGTTPGKTWQQMKFIAQMMTAQANADEGKKKRWRR